MPPHLLGVWQTSEPKFAGCWIEFSNGMLILGLRTGEEASYPINGIESKRLDGGSVMYTIHYKDYEKQKSKLSFEYDPASGGTLQLKNHSEVWERAG